MPPHGETTGLPLYVAALDARNVPKGSEYFCFAQKAWRLRNHSENPLSHNFLSPDWVVWIQSRLTSVLLAIKGPTDSGNLLPLSLTLWDEVILSRKCNIEIELGCSVFFFLKYLLLFCFFIQSIQAV